MASGGVFYRTVIESAAVYLCYYVQRIMCVTLFTSGEADTRERPITTDTSMHRSVMSNTGDRGRKEPTDKQPPLRGLKCNICGERAFGWCDHECRTNLCAACGRCCMQCGGCTCGECPCHRPHAATRMHWSLNSVTDSDEERIQMGNPPDYEAMFKAERNIIAKHLQDFVDHYGTTFKVSVVIKPITTTGEEIIMRARVAENIFNLLSAAGKKQPFEFLTEGMRYKDINILRYGIIGGRDLRQLCVASRTVHEWVGIIGIEWNKQAKEPCITVWGTA